ncbi:DMT family transporter [Enterovibrio nigricans]|uniref:EamA domain-containing membrane protein RarD n=1 Tax=Enterovibrio nigricans DSM 22720 TaxID=1121868 RepID=A0A1T4VB68_9GAMM|nr:DMT family transporter [Enterovibrio nigricans]PKF49842.1 EamA/RhaT family transporter [Enterovibrio nigricans]SKA62212.1 EamA domain-containing membrane protein RarD [Enterovibrio nigricans DSM 22720]
MSPIYKGTITMIVGVSILSVDGLLIRLIESSGWTLLFWRGLLSAAVILLVMFIKQPAETRRVIVNPSPILLLGSLAFSISTICFVLSIDHTQVASTLIIINISPLICAALAFVFLKERLEVKTLVAILAAVAGVMFVFAGKTMPSASFGNLMALITAVMLATYFVVLRKNQSENAAMYLVLGGLSTALISYFAGAKPFELTSQEWIYTLILCVGVVPISFMLISSGPRYLPAAHANLFMLLEAILGPLFVWIALGEVPTQNVLIGGGIIFATLLVFTMSAAHTKKRLNKKPG